MDRFPARTSAIALGLALVAAAVPALATETAPTSMAAGTSAPHAAVPPQVTLDPAIVAALGRITASDLREIDTTLVSFGTRNLFSEGLHDPKRGVYAARDWLSEQFASAAKASNGRMTVKLDTFMQEKTPRTPRAVETSSVYATLRGDDPSRGTIVISSHYDSRNSDGSDATKDAPGADDNGSGTSAVVEAARALAPMHVKATVVFVCFDGEEQGLFGSAHFAKMLKAQGVRVEANFNNDIVGASVGHDGESQPYDVRVFSEALPADAKPSRVNATGTENDSPARELARAAKRMGEAYVPQMRVNLVYRADRFLRGGDQESFSEQEYPAIRYVEPHENFDHQHQDVRVENGVQYGDLLAYVDFDYLARVTRLNVAALATLALAPPVPVAQLDNRGLGYTSTLLWDAVPGAASYEVVWRQTTDALWMHARNVGNVTTATLPLSKDDWLFGVRALDGSGHGSFVAFPTPRRS
ncbi:MAG: M20/M25/M40 family metallo-hydrolase [Vulcanimicrobiaceae bacterium]